MSEALCDLFQQVLNREIQSTNVSYATINQSVVEIQTTYRRISKNRPISGINYNDVSYRYAYIYLYSVCHTATVAYQIGHLRTMPSQFMKIMHYKKRELNICSLGGGPGCDVVGLLIARSQGFGFIGNTSRIRCTVVDICEGWRASCHHVFTAYLTSYAGCFYQGIIALEFVQADLCTTIPLESVQEVVRKSDIVKLVKFVSVVSHDYHCNPALLQNIFSLMKRGAYVVFLDNSNGGFSEIVSNSAQNAGLIPVIPRMSSRWYVNADNMVPRLSSPPLCSTSVTFAVWQKCR